MTKNDYRRTFYGYLRLCTQGKRPGAAALLAMCGPGTCHMKQIQAKITSQLAVGKIDAQRAEDLSEFLAEMYDEFMRSEQIIDCRDARDWRRLPGGGHMRVAHMDADTNDYETRQEVRR